MGRLWKALEDEVKRRKIHERVVSALVDAAIGLKVKNPTYRNLAGISNQTAKYDLKRLADEGLLVPRGEKKGRYYVAGELVRQLRNETRSKRRITDPFEELEKTNQAKQQELPGFNSTTESL